MHQHSHLYLPSVDTSVRACISIHIIYMGWQRCLLYGDCPKPGADSNVAVAAKPFSVDFDVAARDGRLWVRFAGRTCTTRYAESCHATARGNWSELVLKGISWSGFSAWRPGTN